MGLFSRRTKGDDADAAESTEPQDVTSLALDDDIADDGRPVRPDTAEPNEVERATIDAGLAELARRGIDLDDVDALGAAYDAAVAQRESNEADSPALVGAFAAGIGEHLVRHAGMRWQQITDVFGTDLGVVASRGNSSIIPSNVVAARWLGRQTGWLPGYVAHLVRINTR